MTTHIHCDFCDAVQIPDFPMVASRIGAAHICAQCVLHAAEAIAERERPVDASEIEEMIRPQGDWKSIPADTPYRTETVITGIIRDLPEDGLYDPDVVPGGLYETAIIPVSGPIETVDVGAGSWSLEDDIKLLRGERMGTSIESMERSLGRTGIEIEERLEELCPEPRNPTTIGAAIRKIETEIKLRDRQLQETRP